VNGDRAALAALLGGFAPSRFETISRAPEPAEGVRAEKFILERDDGVAVRGYLTGPNSAWRGLPSVVYCHAHGAKYDIGARELLDGRPALRGPYAADFARQGIVALALDMPCFGDRATEPESAAAKRHLWSGKTLFGEMLSDLAGAIDLLAAQDGVDAKRIGAFGLSMGATLAFWLAALDARIAAVAHLCCFADLGELVRRNGHDLHGIYMTVPGLLPKFRTGQIAGLAAPRPHYAAMGAQDPLTPPGAIDIAVADLKTAYGGSAKLDIHVDPDTGHVETPRMRADVLRFFAENL
jgi:dienelactone hydrolase